MNRLLIPIVLSLPCLAFAQDSSEPTLAASDLSYDYAQLRHVDLDEGNGDGLRFGGSHRLGDDWIALGEITSYDLDGNVDRSTLELGGGYVHGLDRNFDLITTLSLIHTEIDRPFPFGDSDDSGIGMSLGTRGMLTPELELRGSVRHVKLDDSDTFLELGGDYHFTERFSAGASTELAGDTDLFTIGARLHF